VRGRDCADGGSTLEPPAQDAAAEQGSRIDDDVVVAAADEALAEEHGGEQASEARHVLQLEDPGNERDPAVPGGECSHELVGAHEHLARKHPWEQQEEPKPIAQPEPRRSPAGSFAGKRGCGNGIVLILSGSPPLRTIPGSWGNDA